MKRIIALGLALLICNSIPIFSWDQLQSQGQFEIVGYVPSIAEIEFYHTEGSSLDLRIDKLEQYLAKISINANTGYTVFCSSLNGGKMVDSTGGDYSIPYQLFYNGMLIEFDETGSYHLVVEKEKDEIFAENKMSGKAIVMAISFVGKPELPRNIYRDTITIQIEASTLSGGFLGMSHELYIRGFVNSQFL